MRRAGGAATWLLAMQVFSATLFGVPAWARPAHHAAPPPLTKADEAQRHDAEQRLNDRNPVMIGMQERWQGETAEGVVRLERLYREHGLECHLLTESVRSGAHGRWRVTHPVACRVPDGDWRLRG